jgi:hypothetical protein
LRTELTTAPPKTKTHAPLSVGHNQYHDQPKRSDIYTPPPVAEFIFELLRNHNYQTVLDPAIGQGALTAPWRAAGHSILGCDIEAASKPYADVFRIGPFEAITDWDAPKPDIAIVNAPFNGADKKALYPEVFLKSLVHLFGPNLPIVLFAPMGLLLNQRMRSTRWQWLRDCGLEITSILSLPLDVFRGVEFHAEVIFLNIAGLKPHYFLSHTAWASLLQGPVIVNLKSGTYFLAHQKSAQKLKNGVSMTEQDAISRGFSYAHDRIRPALMPSSR